MFPSAEHLEIIAFSAVLALTALAVFSTAVGTLVYLFAREPGPAPAARPATTAVPKVPAARDRAGELTPAVAG
jgi:hypothetical protein